jgi:hypothetical protein
MEVHHHSHKPKNWKEYFLEFFMLFAAVTLGFFAENVREHYIESHREKQYMESLLADLEIDKKSIEKSIPYQVQRVNSMDSIFRYFKSNPNADIVPVSLIKHMKRVSWELLSFRNTTTIAQLKNSGALRLIQNKIVTDSIDVYDMRWNRMELTNNRFYTNQRDIYLLEEKIINAFDSLEAFMNNDGFDNQDNIPEVGFVKINRSSLSEYLNFLARQQTVTRQDIRLYKQTLLTTENLMHLIRKEYHLL